MKEIGEALAELATDAPDGFDGHVFAGWLTAPSRVGDVHVAVTDAGVQYVRPADRDPEEFAQDYRDRFGRPLRPLPRAPRGLLPALRTAVRAVDGGRDGESDGGTDSARHPALDLGGLRPFERDVLRATRRIPAGQVRPYAWVAREAGRPAAVRAVGTVLARNPVPLLVPCHRVVRSDGELGDYMLGPERKRALLTDEDLDVDGLAELSGRGVRYLGSDTTGIVCFPSCRHARRITDAHRVPFRRIDAALERGYRPCRDCRPAAAAA